VTECDWRRHCHPSELHILLKPSNGVPPPPQLLMRRLSDEGCASWLPPRHASSAPDRSKSSRCRRGVSPQTALPHIAVPKSAFIRSVRLDRPTTAWRTTVGEPRCAFNESGSGLPTTGLSSSPDHGSSVCYKTIVIPTWPAISAPSLVTVNVCIVLFVTVRGQTSV